MVRRILAAAALAVMAVGLGACGGAGGAGAHASDAPPRVAFDSPQAKEKLGQDDGFHAAIFYGAELMGSIDDCGCPGHPQGGLPWRLGYTEGFRSAYPDAGYLQVDAGNSMADLKDVSGKLYSDQNTKNEWVLKAFDRFNFDAANIAHQDLYFVSQFLKDGGAYDEAVKKYPVLARFVSANLQPVDPNAGLVAPPPYVVRTMSGARIPGGSVRVAVVGLTENNPNLPQHTGFTVTAPDVALEKVLPKARSESDFVVVLYYAGPDAARALAQRFGDQVNVFVVAHPKARDAEPSFTTQSNIAFARYQTRQLGELRLRFDGRNVASIENRYVTLDEQLPKDPIATEMAAEAKEAIKKAQEERFNANPPAVQGGS
jgi:hypothetical protein